jgi:hypothetical protein
MGTRALTFVYEGETPIINMYRQYDGYPTGHGAELAQFLGSGQMVNGLTSRDEPVFNGMGCLAAQMIAHFKQTPGGFYIHPVTDTECGQDYEYHIYQGEVTQLDEEGIEQKTTGLRVRITDRGCNMFGLTMSETNTSVFDGTVQEFAEYCGVEVTA